MTINDILSSSSSKPASRQTLSTSRYGNEQTYTDISPSRPSRIVKAQKFQSPVKSLISG